MFAIYFIKTMALILIYLAFGVTLPVVGLYIHQIYTHLKSEKQPKQKDVNYGVRRAAKILVFSITVLIDVGNIAGMIATLSWMVELKNAIGHLVIVQPGYAMIFAGLIAFPFLYLRKLTHESTNSEK